MQTNDRVLLIDVENTVGSVRPRPELVRSRVSALVDAAGPVHHVVACYAQDDPSADVVVSVLAELGVAPWPVPSGANAADHALLQHARYVYRRGGRVFAVASADRRFAELAKLGRLEVLVWENQPVARVLTTAAGINVRRLAPPASNGRDPAPEPPPTADSQTPDPRGTGAGTGTGDATDRLPDTSTSPPPGSDADAQDSAHLTSTATSPSLAHGLLSAVLTGFGIGVGQRIAASLLDRRR